MTTRHLKESYTSISSSVAVQCTHYVFLCCQYTVNEQLQLHVNCLKLFMEMKLYLAQDFSGWSGDKMVTEVQKSCACKSKGSKQ